MDDSTPNSGLTASDLAVLSALDRGEADAAALAERAGVPPDRLADRLSFLTDNGLVRPTEAGYELTDSGRQVIRVPGDGTADDSIDVPPVVVEVLHDRGLRADRLDAVLAAFDFLRYWGRATAAELRDGAFSEVPLEYAGAEAWWTAAVRDHLAAIPFVERPPTEDGFWRFTGTPGVAALADDGRRVLFGRRSPASATEAMARAELPEDRRLAVAAALAALQRGERDPEALRRAAASVEAGERPNDEWLEGPLFETLERLPGVVRAGDEWRYTLTPDGYDPA